MLHRGNAASPEGRAPTDRRPVDGGTHPKVNARRPRTTVIVTVTNQLAYPHHISISTSLSQKNGWKKKHDRHNIAPWSTAHARPATPPPSIFHHDLDLIILFFYYFIIIVIILSNTKKGPRCARKRLCGPRARRYIRPKRIRTLRSTTLRSSRLSVPSLFLSLLPMPALLFYFILKKRRVLKNGVVFFFYMQRISNR